jgi:lysophospholipase L1-like esterase
MGALADNYSAAPGVVIRGGRFAPYAGPSGLTGDVMVAGDSLTDLGYNSSGYRLGFPLTLFPPRIVFNAGWQGQTVSDLADRLQSHITAYPSANTIVIRIGTNGAGGSGVYATEFGRLLTILSANGKKGVFHYATPRAGTAGVDNPMIAVNAALKSQCDANPSYLAYIADCQDVLDVNGNVISSYTVGDSIHFNGKGVDPQAVRMQPRYSVIFAPVEARLLDGTDKYPSNGASNQYCQNPLNVGTSGTVGSGVTGTAPDSWAITGYGGGSGGVASIVAADAGDPVQVPWMRVTSITSGGAGHEVDLNTNLQHPAIAADATIKRLDIVAEIRYNFTDASALQNLYLLPNVGGTAVGNVERINLSGITGALSRRIVMRSSLPRTQQPQAGNSAALVAYVANSIKLTIGLSFAAANATPMGYIDIRCVSVRGSTT